MLRDKIPWEVAFIALVLLIITGFAIPAFQASRIQVRDNLRKEDLTNIKRSLEAYYNDFERYPFSATEEACTKSDDPNSWFFSITGDLLQGQYIDALPHDIREQSGHYYTYCSANDGQGYTLEARLEQNVPDEFGFDEDEKRKFHYRIYQKDGVVYRVCGGSQSEQCQDPLEN